MNVDDVEFVESVRLANVCVRSNFSNASSDADEDEDDEEEEAEEDDVIVCSFDWELSRLSREMSFVENEIWLEASEGDRTSEQRLRTNGQ